jgi:hypothetical protein
MQTKAFPNARRSQRVSVKEFIRLVTKVQGKESRQAVSSVDLSAHGVRILVNRPLDQGQVVYAIPELSGDPLGYCRVVWIHPAGMGDKEQAGLEFVSPK